ncbi:MAG: hypothetical protein ACFFEF_13295 [Candidatus Thorarchaeota archaeon]
MKSEKWKLVGGCVYRLAKVCENMLDAIALAREMKEKNHVFLSKTETRQWAVYWRPKISEIECELKYYSA